jgi:hypothetical protein
MHRMVAVMIARRERQAALVALRHLNRRRLKDIGVYRSNAKSERLDAGPLDRLAAMVTQQEELTEQFKSSNALLQNSLSYVGLLSTGTMFGAEESPLAPATGAITAALLNLRRDTSPEAVKALMERIDRFAAQAPSIGPDAEAAQALLGHGRLLYRLLPEIDVTLKTW